MQCVETLLLLFWAYGSVVDTQTATLVEEVSTERMREILLPDAAPWILLFSAHWCVHCKNVTKGFSEAASLAAVTTAANVRFGRVESNSVLAYQFGVSAFPTFFYTFQGRAFRYAKERGAKAFHRLADSAYSAWRRRSFAEPIAVENSSLESRIDPHRQPFVLCAEKNDGDATKVWDVALAAIASTASVQFFRFRLDDAQDAVWTKNDELVASLRTACHRFALSQLTRMEGGPLLAFGHYPEEPIPYLGALQCERAQSCIPVVVGEGIPNVLAPTVSLITFVGDYAIPPVSALTPESYADLGRCKGIGVAVLSGTESEVDRASVVAALAAVARRRSSPRFRALGRRLPLATLDDSQHGDWTDSFHIDRSVLPIFVVVDVVDRAVYSIDAMHDWFRIRRFPNASRDWWTRLPWGAEQEEAIEMLLSGVLLQRVEGAQFSVEASVVRVLLNIPGMNILYYLGGDNVAFLTIVAIILLLGAVAFLTAITIANTAAKGGRSENENEKGASHRKPKED